MSAESITPKTNTPPAPVPDLQEGLADTQARVQGLASAIKCPDTPTSPYSARSYSSARSSPALLSPTGSATSSTDDSRTAEVRDPSYAEGFKDSSEYYLFTGDPTTAVELRIRGPLDETLVFKFEKTNIGYQDIESRESFASLEEVEEFYLAKEQLTKDYFGLLNSSDASLLKECRKVIDIVSSYQAFLQEAIKDSNKESMSMKEAFEALAEALPKTLEGKKGLRFYYLEGQPLLLRHKIKELGKGTYKVVTEKVAICFDENVAKKTAEGKFIYNTANPYPDEDLFARESNILGLFTGDPNILQIDYAHDVYVDGTPTKGLLATELCEGNLFVLKSTLTPEQKKTFACGILRALISMKKRGIIHRDLSCSNLLVGKDGEIKVSDFGLAVYENEVGKAQIQKGTFYTLAPEVLENYRKKASERTNCTTISDMFSAGIAIEEMMVGYIPVMIETQTLLEDWNKTKRRDYLDAGIENIYYHFTELGKMAIDNDDPLLKLILKMINPDPSKRISPEAALQEMENISLDWF